MAILRKPMTVHSAIIAYPLLGFALGLLIFSHHKIFSTQAKKVLVFFKWLIVAMALNNCYQFLTHYLNGDELTRMQGNYSQVYWILSICSCLLPFSLFIPKLGKSFFYNLLMVLSVYFGFFAEKFVIIVTNYHRDFAPNDSSILNYLLVFIGPLLYLSFGFLASYIVLNRAVSSEKVSNTIENDFI